MALAFTRRTRGRRELLGGRMGAGDVVLLMQPRVEKEISVRGPECRACKEQPEEEERDLGRKREKESPYNSCNPRAGPDAHARYSHGFAALWRPWTAQVRSSSHPCLIFPPFAPPTVLLPPTFGLSFQTPQGFPHPLLRGPRARRVYRHAHVPNSHSLPARKGGKKRKRGARRAIALWERIRGRTKEVRAFLGLRNVHTHTYARVRGIGNDRRHVHSRARPFAALSQSPPLQNCPHDGSTDRCSFICSRHTRERFRHSVRPRRNVAELIGLPSEC